MRVRHSPLTGRFDPSSILTELIDFGLEYEENGCFFTKSCSVSLKSITQGNELQEILANVRVPD